MPWVIGGAILGSSLVGASSSKRASNAKQSSVRDSIAASQAASAEGQTYLSPLMEVGQQGIDQAGFLTDPNQQFDWLQKNPLFNLALENANRGTMQSAAASGRLSAGDTLQQLSNNVLLSASPLISGQKQSINDLLNLASGTATAQANTAIGAGTNTANLLTQGGNAQAAGIIGQANAIQGGIGNALSAYMHYQPQAPGYGAGYAQQMNPLLMGGGISPTGADISGTPF